MKILLILFISIVSLTGKAQIDYKLSFNKTTQVVTIKLTNMFNEVVYLSPKIDGSTTATYFTIKYKDINGKILKTISDYASIKRTDFLTSKQTKDYHFNLHRSKVEGVHSIEANVHIEVWNNKYITIFKKDISEEFLLKE